MMEIHKYEISTGEYSILEYDKIPRLHNDSMAIRFASHLNIVMRCCYYWAVHVVDAEITEAD